MSLFSFFNKKNRDDKKSSNKNATTSNQQTTPTATTDQADQKDSYQSGLTKTRSSFWSGLTDLFKSTPTLSQEVIETIRTRLLIADVGTQSTDAIITALNEAIKKSPAPVSTEDAIGFLSDILIARLTARPPTMITPGNGPHVILIVGINGSGKTTTLGKLAAHYQAAGHSVLLAAGDTFRAAAIEQLQGWGKRLNLPVVAQKQGGDAASVLFDAVSSAKAKSIDVVLADTAGRLHNKSHLMEELKKIKRVLQKIGPEYPQETLLVVDGTLGQNSLAQAAAFHESIGIDAIIVTKLDGSAKGGALFALQESLGLPIQYVGLGERAQDLKPFDAKRFVHALLDHKHD
jgi:fused signal recognition particle receptor